MKYKKYVTFSFDDGIEQDKKLIALMKKYKLKGTFNISSGILGKHQVVAGFKTFGFMEQEEYTKRHSWMSYVPQYRIRKNEIVKVYEGFEVASHAYRHESFGTIKKEKMQESVDLDLYNLEQIVGYKIRGHAYAKGAASKAAQDYLKQKGIVYARNTRSSNNFFFPESPLNFSPTCSHTSKKVFHLIDEFLAREPVDDDMMLYIWGHGYECDYNTADASWEKIEKIFSQISSHKELTYCTNIEAFEEHAMH